MDKEVLTEADISTLIKTSKKMKPGETIIANLKTDITGKDSGEPRVTKEIIEESVTYENKVVGFPSTSPIMGEGISGIAVIDAFKKDRTGSKRRQHFSLKRSFFSCLEKLETTINNTRLNLGRIVYKYDDFGRVYVIVNGKKLYLNKSRTKGITEDGEFADIRIYEDYIELEYYYKEDLIYEPDFVNFDYLYISVEAAKRGEQLINAEEDRLNRELISSMPGSFISDQSTITDNPNNIIDLEEYRRIMEDGPKR